MKILAFYLPQFHRIPENDAWWGEGFNEWINVKKAKPLFQGHYQPHIPADLGYYDLTFEETRVAQAKLAAQFGISGFCYYHYWFNGKMLLERPFNEILQSGKPDFPFCLCWANENWTKRWDGHENEVLMKQDYDEYDPLEHIQWLAKAFTDNRYIKVNGKPLFLIYRPEDIKNIEKHIKLWHKVLKDLGYPGIYICSVKNMSNKLSDIEAINLGFDAIVEFQPNMRFAYPVHLKYWNYLKYIFPRVVNKLIDKFQLNRYMQPLIVRNILSYKALAENAMRKPISGYKTFPGVMPSWDNSPRKKVNATVIQNDDEELYRKWLEDSFDKVKQYSEDEQIVFVNAWNEWAEGCHLEPDKRNGAKFLQATKDALYNYYGHRRD